MLDELNVAVDVYHSGESDRDAVTVSNARCPRWSAAGAAGDVSGVTEDKVRQVALQLFFVCGEMFSSEQ